MGMLTLKKALSGEDRERFRDRYGVSRVRNQHCPLLVDLLPRLHARFDGATALRTLRRSHAAAALRSLLGESYEVRHREGMMERKRKADETNYKARRTRSLLEPRLNTALVR